MRRGRRLRGHVPRGLPGAAGAGRADVEGVLQHNGGSNSAAVGVRVRVGAGPNDDAAQDPQVRDVSV